MSVTLQDVIGPSDWCDIERRAWEVAEVTGRLAYAVRMQWYDPSGFRHRHVAIMCANAATTGLTEHEIINIIHNTRKEILDGT